MGAGLQVHPYFNNESLIARCHLLGIHVMAYSPLGSSGDKAPEQHGCTLLQHPVVHSVAAEAGKSAGQVCYCCYCC